MQSIAIDPLLWYSNKNNKVLALKLHYRLIVNSENMTLKNQQSEPCFSYKRKIPDISLCIYLSLQTQLIENATTTLNSGVDAGVFCF